MITLKNRFNIFLMLITFLGATPSFATNQNAKLWLGINAKQTLSADKKWLSFIFAQVRFINESHPWQVGLVEGGLGYAFFKDNTIWFGYRWGGHQPYDGFYQENELFQQLIGQIDLTESNKLVFRTRLEEIERGYSSQISIRLRERIAFELVQKKLGLALPHFYDELFFQVKKTDYTTNRFVSQNRIFLGFNVYTSNLAWWEIGYINQFQISRAGSPNSMNHIASITYNFS